MKNQTQNNAILMKFYIKTIYKSIVNHQNIENMKHKDNMR